MKKLSILMIISLFAAFLIACGGKSDADIQKDVQTRVKAKAPNVTVSSVKDGVVTLGGYVTTPEEKSAAVAAANGEGVKKVDDFNIQTRPAPTPMMPAATPMMSPMMSPGGRPGASPMNSPARPGTSPARR
ncbi:MAG TPA: BON domain-containing protein [Pyrinomonadaceae bacterium]